MARAGAAMRAKARRDTTGWVTRLREARANAMHDCLMQIKSGSSQMGANNGPTSSNVGCEVWAFVGAASRTPMHMHKGALSELSAASTRQLKRQQSSHGLGRAEAWAYPCWHTGCVGGHSSDSCRRFSHWLRRSEKDLFMRCCGLQQHALATRHNLCSLPMLRRCGRAVPKGLDSTHTAA